MDKENIIEDILVLAEKLFRKLLPAVPEELLKMDITMPQLKIMLLLFFHGPTRMTDIAAELDVSLPTATSLVEKLVEKHYVIRESQADDRRVVLCELSDTGQKVINGIWETARGRTHQLLESIDTASLSRFADMLETMLESAETDSQRNIVSNKKVK